MENDAREAAQRINSGDTYDVALLAILEIKSKETIPELTDPEAFGEIVTQSSRMQRVLKEAELHAVSDVPILINGESGTGKELLAQAIHARALG